MDRPVHISQDRDLIRRALRQARIKGAEPQVSSQKSTYFKADAYIPKKPEIKQALKAVWDEALLESSAEGLPAFVHAWKCLRLQAKNLQYAEVAKLSNLETLQGELEELAKTEELSQGRLAAQYALFMDSLPTHGEFTDVMLNSAKGKALGIDGFNVDTLQFVWDFVGPVYSSAMQYC
ncbi:hypothetical protein R1sor_004608 [Riccia sorocarpa]|uniref:Uncharacterized protein n=1 Tax=Riccia sorocarpa TaxID=122646 RepID=A0ABD3HKP0_9MARC